MKEKEVVKRIKKEVKGITLMVLVVTIIVLLILAGIGLRLALGENGIIGGTLNAKEAAEIAEEKETINLAAFGSKVKNNKLILEEEEFQKSLDGYTGAGKTEVTDIGEEFEVVFNETNRYYVVDKNGNIKETGEIVKDKYPGDITVGKDGESLDGGEEHPYEIWCIEDLVAFSNMVNRTGKVYKNGELINGENSIYLNENSNVKLMRNLNFKSSLSYTNSKRTDFGDINNDEKQDELMIELTTARGFTPIGFKINNRLYTYTGTFDGCNNKISNIYINYSDDSLDEQYGFGRSVGLFGSGNSGSTTILNLEVSGDIIGLGHTGGIIGDSAKYIENCINRATISGNNKVGGIAGGAKKIVKCKNYGTLSANKVVYAYTGVGGITSNADEIIDCENLGDIKISKDNVSNQGSGGYGGISANGGIIKNCINRGNIIVEENGIKKCCGGIVGRITTISTLIQNCENYGNIQATGYIGGIIGMLEGFGWDYIVEIKIENCMNNAKSLTSANSENTVGGIIGQYGRIFKECNVEIKNSYNTSSLNYGIIGDILGNAGIQKFTTQNVYDVNKEHYHSLNPNLIYTGNIIEKAKSEMQKQEFVDLLNSYQDENGKYPSEWKKWKLGEDGYPTFDN